MTQKFLPCPFCGGDAQYYYHTPRDMMNSHHIECDDCSNGTCLHETKAEAIAAWNTRTLDPEALRSMVLQQGVNAANAAKEYAEEVERLRGALEDILASAGVSDDPDILMIDARSYDDARQALQGQPTVTEQETCTKN